MDVFSDGSSTLPASTINIATPFGVAILMDTVENQNARGK